MAPGADLVYLGTRCDDDRGALAGLDALTEITDHHLASIVSDSWGVINAPSPGLIAAYEQVFEQGAAEGTGFYFGTGDWGDGATLPGNQHEHTPPAFFPTSDSWVTSVGGTSLAIGRHGNYEWETGWGDDAAHLAASTASWAALPGAFAMGAGGGTSTLFRQPSYQRGVVPASLSRANDSAVPMRVVPDIAADADPLTGNLVGEMRSAGTGQPASYGEGSAGGTSASTPLIAGLQADAQQASGAPIGFANPVIYARYGSPAFHDVTDDPLAPAVRLDAVVPAPASAEPPQLFTFGRDEGLAAGPGYDDVTGVGTPAARYFTVIRHRPARISRPG